MKKHLLVVGILFLFILSSVSPLAFGNNIDSTEYDIDPLQEYYGCYSLEEIPESIRPVILEEGENQGIPEMKNVVNLMHSPELLDDPIDSSWPMYCHDVRHTGRSPYSTSDNPGVEKWRIRTNGWADGSPVIDDENVIYIGAAELYAIYPNGTMKWNYDIPHKIVHAPAIDEDGIIYFGTIEAMPNYLYAIYTNNGSLKWKYNVGDHIWSSPAIGNDGTIFFGSNNHHIYALYPNGTLRWKYTTGNAVLSSPAIGEDGTVYCGSHSSYLYALYPNNGTLKWKYKTGNWIRTAPCIGDDGTIFVVSLDNYLHAVNPNGTMKWKTDVGAGTSPTIGQDGTIYAGYRILYAIYPNNGSVKWTFNPGSDRRIRGGTPCNSIDGMIYFGTNIGDYDGGEIITVYPDGTEKWRKMIANDWVDSAPAIGEDGTVYIGSAWSPSDGYLYAFGKLDPNAPSSPTITGQTTGTVGTAYEYTFMSTSSLGRDVYYYITWGDGSIKNWFGVFGSGEEVKVTHTYSNQGTYTIKARAKDTDNLWGSWGELEVSMPRNKMITSLLWLKLFEQFSLLEVFISRIANL